MEWFDFIGNLAFPIAMCCALFWKMNDQDNKHAAESKGFMEAIENNTEAITSLTELIRTKM